MRVGIDQDRLDPVCRDFSTLCSAQKAEFKGESFPSSMICTDTNQSFLDFSQLERATLKEKGLIAIPIAHGPLLLRRETP